MERLESTALAPTRDYLQDVAKAVGKVQQLFLAPTPNDWQKGLEISESGLATPELPGPDTRIVIDLKRGDVSNSQTAWKLGEYSAPDLLKDLGAWAAAAGASARLAKPDFGRAGPEDYDSVQAAHIANALHLAKQQLVHLEPLLLTGTVSPILLYPHHFDVSLVWFPLRRDENDAEEKRQLGFGFSFGDEYIGEPYFYSTAWPQPQQFSKTVLPQPAFWHTAGFSGAVLKYNDAAQQADPGQIVQDFLRTAAQGGSDAFGA